MTYIPRFNPNISVSTLDGYINKTELTTLQKVLNNLLPAEEAKSVYQTISAGQDLSNLESYRIILALSERASLGKCSAEDIWFIKEIALVNQKNTAQNIEKMGLSELAGYLNTISEDIYQHLFTASEIDKLAADVDKGIFTEWDKVSSEIVFFAKDVYGMEKMEDAADLKKLAENIRTKYPEQTENVQQIQPTAVQYTGRKFTAEEIDKLATTVEQFEQGQGSLDEWDKVSADVIKFAKEVYNLDVATGADLRNLALAIRNNQSGQSVVDNQGHVKYQAPTEILPGGHKLKEQYSDFFDFVANEPVLYAKDTILTELSSVLKAIIAKYQDQDKYKNILESIFENIQATELKFKSNIQLEDINKLDVPADLLRILQQAYTISRTVNPKSFTFTNQELITIADRLSIANQNNFYSDMDAYTQEQYTLLYSLYKTLCENIRQTLPLDRILTQVDNPTVNDFDKLLNEVQTILFNIFAKPEILAKIKSLYGNETFCFSAFYINVLGKYDTTQKDSTIASIIQDLPAQYKGLQTTIQAVLGQYYQIYNDLINLKVKNFGSGEFFYMTAAESDALKQLASAPELQGKVLEWGHIINAANNGNIGARALLRFYEAKRSGVQGTNPLGGTRTFNDTYPSDLQLRTALMQYYKENGLENIYINKLLNLYELGAQNKEYVKTAKEELKFIKTKLDAIDQQVTSFNQLRKQISEANTMESFTKAIANFNQFLTSFFGNQEITITPDDIKNNEIFKKKMATIAQEFSNSVESRRATLMDRVKQIENESSEEVEEGQSSFESFKIETTKYIRDILVTKDFIVWLRSKYQILPTNQSVITKSLPQDSYFDLVGLHSLRPAAESTDTRLNDDLNKYKNLLCKYISQNTDPFQPTFNNPLSSTNFLGLGNIDLITSIFNVDSNTFNQAAQTLNWQNILTMGKAFQIPEAQIRLYIKTKLLADQVPDANNLTTLVFPVGFYLPFFVCSNAMLDKLLTALEASFTAADKTTDLYKYYQQVAEEVEKLKADPASQATYYIKIISGDENYTKLLLLLAKAENKELVQKLYQAFGISQPKDFYGVTTVAEIDILAASLTEQRNKLTEDAQKNNKLNSQGYKDNLAKYDSALAALAKIQQNRETYPNGIVTDFQTAAVYDLLYPTKVKLPLIGLLNSDEAKKLLPQGDLLANFSEYLDELHDFWLQDKEGFYALLGGLGLVAGTTFEASFEIVKQYFLTSFSLSVVMPYTIRIGGIVNIGMTLQDLRTGDISWGNASTNILNTVFQFFMFRSFAPIWYQGVVDAIDNKQYLQALAMLLVTNMLTMSGGKNSIWAKTLGLDRALIWSTLEKIPGARRVLQQWVAWYENPYEGDNPFAKAMHEFRTDYIPKYGLIPGLFQCLPKKMQEALGFVFKAINPIGTAMESNPNNRVIQMLQRFNQKLQFLGSGAEILYVGAKKAKDTIKYELQNYFKYQASLSGLPAKDFVQQWTSQNRLSANESLAKNELYPVKAEIVFKNPGLIDAQNSYGGTNGTVEGMTELYNKLFVEKVLGNNLTFNIKLKLEDGKPATSTTIKVNRIVVVDGPDAKTEFVVRYRELTEQSNWDGILYISAKDLADPNLKAIIDKAITGKTFKLIRPNNNTENFNNNLVKPADADAAFETANDAVCGAQTTQEQKAQGIINEFLELKDKYLTRQGEFNKELQNKYLELQQELSSLTGANKTPEKVQEVLNKFRPYMMAEIYFDTYKTNPAAAKQLSDAQLVAQYLFADYSKNTFLQIGTGIGKTAIGGLTLLERAILIKYGDFKQELGSCVYWLTSSPDLVKQFKADDFVFKALADRLGIKFGLRYEGQSVEEAMKSYMCDIVLGDSQLISDIGSGEFRYEEEGALRDLKNMIRSGNVLFDEADALLVLNARINIIISGTDSATANLMLSWFSKQFDTLSWKKYLNIYIELNTKDLFKEDGTLKPEGEALLQKYYNNATDINTAKANFSKLYEARRLFTMLITGETDSELTARYNVTMSNGKLLHISPEGAPQEKMIFGGEMDEAFVTIFNYMMANRNDPQLAKQFGLSKKAVQEFFNKNAPGNIFKLPMEFPEQHSTFANINIFQFLAFHHMRISGMSGSMDLMREIFSRIYADKDFIDKFAGGVNRECLVYSIPSPIKDMFFYVKNDTLVWKIEDLKKDFRLSPAANAQIKRLLGGDTKIEITDPEVMKKVVKIMLTDIYKSEKLPSTSTLLKIFINGGDSLTPYADVLAKLDEAAKEVIAEQKIQFNTKKDYGGLLAIKQEKDTIVCATQEEKIDLLARNAIKEAYKNADFENGKLIFRGGKPEAYQTVLVTVDNIEMVDKIREQINKYLSEYEGKDILLAQDISARDSDKQFKQKIKNAGLSGQITVNSRLARGYDHKSDADTHWVLDPVSQEILDNAVGLKTGNCFVLTGGLEAYEALKIQKYGRTYRAGDPGGCRNIFSVDEYKIRDFGSINKDELLKIWPGIENDLGKYFDNPQDQRIRPKVSLEELMERAKKDFSSKTKINAIEQLFINAFPLKVQEGSPQTITYGDKNWQILFDKKGYVDRYQVYYADKMLDEILGINTRSAQEFVNFQEFADLRNTRFDGITSLMPKAIEYKIQNYLQTIIKAKITVNDLQKIQAFLDKTFSVKVDNLDALLGKSPDLASALLTDKLFKFIKIPLEQGKLEVDILRIFNKNSTIYLANADQIAEEINSLCTQDIEAKNKIEATLRANNFTQLMDNTINELLISFFNRPKILNSVKISNKDIQNAEKKLQEQAESKKSPNIAERTNIDEIQTDGTTATTKLNVDNDTAAKLDTFAAEHPNLEFPIAVINDVTGIKLEMPDEKFVMDCSKYIRPEGLSVFNGEKTLDAKTQFSLLYVTLRSYQNDTTLDAFKKFLGEIKYYFGDNLAAEFKNRGADATKKLQALITSERCAWTPAFEEYVKSKGYSGEINIAHYHPEGDGRLSQMDLGFGNSVITATSQGLILVAPKEQSETVYSQADRITADREILEELPAVQEIETRYAELTPKIIEVAETPTAEQIKEIENSPENTLIRYQSRETFKIQLTAQDSTIINDSINSSQYLAQAYQQLKFNEAQVNDLNAYFSAKYLDIINQARNTTANELTLTIPGKNAGQDFNIVIDKNVLFSYCLGLQKTEEIKKRMMVDNPKATPEQITQYIIEQELMLMSPTNTENSIFSRSVDFSGEVPCEDGVVSKKVYLDNYVYQNLSVKVNDNVIPLRFLRSDYEKLITGSPEEVQKAKNNILQSLDEQAEQIGKTLANVSETDIKNSIDSLYAELEKSAIQAALPLRTLSVLDEVAQKTCERYYNELLKKIDITKYDSAALVKEMQRCYQKAQDYAKAAQSQLYESLEVLSYKNNTTCLSREDVQSEVDSITAKINRECGLSGDSRVDVNVRIETNYLPESKGLTYYYTGEFTRGNALASTAFSGLQQGATGFVMECIVGGLYRGAKMLVEQKGSFDEWLNTTFYSGLHSAQSWGVFGISTQFAKSFLGFKGMGPTMFALGMPALDEIRTARPEDVPKIIYQQGIGLGLFMGTQKLSGWLLGKFMSSPSLVGKLSLGAAMLASILWADLVQPNIDQAIQQNAELKKDLDTVNNFIKPAMPAVQAIATGVETTFTAYSVVQGVSWLSTALGISFEACAGYLGLAVVVLSIRGDSPNRYAFRDLNNTGTLLDWAQGKPIFQENWVSNYGDIGTNTPQYNTLGIANLNKNYKDFYPSSGQPVGSCVLPQMAFSSPDLKLDILKCLFKAGVKLSADLEVLVKEFISIEGKQDQASMTYFQYLYAYFISSAFKDIDLTPYLTAYKALKSAQGVLFKEELAISTDELSQALAEFNVQDVILKIRQQASATNDSSSQILLKRYLYEAFADYWATLSITDRNKLFNSNLSAAAILDEYTAALVSYYKNIYAASKDLLSTALYNKNFTAYLKNKYGDKLFVTDPSAVYGPSFALSLLIDAQAYKQKTPELKISDPVWTSLQSSKEGQEALALVDSAFTKMQILQKLQSGQGDQKQLVEMARSKYLLAVFLMKILKGEYRLNFGTGELFGNNPIFAEELVGNSWKYCDAFPSSISRNGVFLEDALLPLLKDILPDPNTIDLRSDESRIIDFKKAVTLGDSPIIDKTVLEYMANLYYTNELKVSENQNPFADSETAARQMNPFKEYLASLGLSDKITKELLASPLATDFKNNFNKPNAMQDIIKELKLTEYNGRPYLTYKGTEILRMEFATLFGLSWSQGTTISVNDDANLLKAAYLKILIQLRQKVGLDSTEQNIQLSNILDKNAAYANLLELMNLPTGIWCMGSISADAKQVKNTLHCDNTYSAQDFKVTINNPRLLVDAYGQDVVDNGHSVLVTSNMQVELLDTNYYHFYEGKYKDYEPNWYRVKVTDPVTKKQYYGYIYNYTGGQIPAIQLKPNRIVNPRTYLLMKNVVAFDFHDPLALNAFTAQLTQAAKKIDPGFGTQSNLENKMPEILKRTEYKVELTASGAVCRIIYNVDEGLNIFANDDFDLMKIDENYLKALGIDTNSLAPDVKQKLVEYIGLNMLIKLLTSNGNPNPNKLRDFSNKFDKLTKELQQYPALLSLVTKEFQNNEIKTSFYANAKREEITADLKKQTLKQIFDTRVAKYLLNTQDPEYKQKYQALLQAFAVANGYKVEDILSGMTLQQLCTQYPQLSLFITTYYVNPQQSYFGRTYQYNPVSINIYNLQTQSIIPGTDKNLSITRIIGPSQFQYTAQIKASDATNNYGRGLYDADGNILATITAGTTIDLIDNNAYKFNSGEFAGYPGEWYKVNYNGKIGYIYSNYYNSRVVDIKKK